MQSITELSLQIEAHIVGFINTTFGGQLERPAKVEQTFDDMGLDSLDRAVIEVELDRRYPQPDDSAANRPNGKQTVAQLADYIAAREFKRQTKQL